MSEHMHLIQMLFHTPVNHIILTWADATDGQFPGMEDFGYWQKLARALEAARFDGVFFADTPAVHDEYKGNPYTSARYGVAWPTHDPMPLVAVMAAATTRLGFGVTLSVGGTAPYLAVRRISTLDALSRGRIGWNVVTGYLRAESRAIGAPEMSHDDRYDVADEYMDVCYKLWDGVSPGAIVADKETGIFADESKVRLVSHQGKHYSCHALNPTMPSRQGRPVIFQAGSSPRGIRFAVKHGEVIFAIQPHLAAMQRFMSDLRDACGAAGRKDVPGVVFGVQPILGSTEEEAKRKIEALYARVPVEAALSRFSGTFGVDLSKFDPDAPIEELADTTYATQGVIAAANASKARSLRELVVRRSHMLRIIGTPEQVAAELERLWRESGCHGFNISPISSPDSILDFAGQVVPLLQRRGVFRTEYAGETFRQNLAN